KAWVTTLVGYFMGMKMTHRDILGHLKRMWRAYDLDEDAGMCMSKLEPSKAPLWVKIFDIPLEAWNADGISRIASMIGNPIIMDRITTSMCKKAYGRASFVKELINVDANEGLIDNIKVCYESLGRSMMLRVEYPWKPPICSHCKGPNNGIAATNVPRDYSCPILKSLGSFYMEVSREGYMEDATERNSIEYAYYTSLA
nr:hypothetical protein [Tanacetum cinerariifolium]